VHGAVYDAVNAIDHRYQPYLVRARPVVLAGRAGDDGRLPDAAGHRAGAAAGARGAFAPPTA
jgi:hypothetical protein